jgi:glyoxylate/hydroxypyruvate reductase A
MGGALARTSPLQVLLVGQWGTAERDAWHEVLRAACGDVTWHLAAEPGAAIGVAVVANPPPGALQGLHGLRLIQSLWAGVDRLLGDATLPPDVPIARMVDPMMTRAMAETAVWATLAAHRGFFTYARQQAEARWLQHPQRRAEEVPVLVLGQGEMGGAAARALAALGYPVSGWSGGAAAGVDSPQAPPAAREEVRRLYGWAALEPALAQAQVVVNLLPLTPRTRGLIDARFLAALPRGAALLNLARGAHVVDDDLLAALDDGHIGHAVLDVFQAEPLSAQHRFWRHPQVTVLPHVAALTDLRSAAAVVAGNLRRIARGEPAQHLVRRERGY